jgi:alpha-ketoglutarate-dependent taurine dioxygenase
MTVTVKHLDAPLGAEISGIDLTEPLTSSDVEVIECVWRDRLVVVFHDQTLSDPQLVAFSNHFGELDPPGPNPYGQPFLKDHPELNVISNVIEDGQANRKFGRRRSCVARRYDVCRHAAQSCNAPSLGPGAKRCSLAGGQTRMSG